METVEKREKVTCCVCKNVLKWNKGDGVPTDSRGLPDESRALCGRCRPKEVEEPVRIHHLKIERPYRTRTGRIGHEEDTLQPYKKAGIGYQINEKFVKKYGSEKLKEWNPEAADWYKKKKGL